MRIGKLNKRITIQERRLAQDATTGDSVPRWIDCCTLWASIEPLSVRNLIAAQAQQSEVTATVTTRYNSGITPEMRVAHGDVIYKIHGVQPDPKSGREYQTILVSHGVTDG